MNDENNTTTRPALWITLLGVLFVGLNLRPAITSVAFVVPDIRNDLVLGATAAGMLTTVPLLAFVVLSMQAPAWGRKFGLARALMASLIILAVGFAIRMMPSATALFVGMAVIGVAITIGNVLLPAFIKARYPDHGGILMGLYTVSLYSGPALASALTVPMANAFGSWRAGLLGWGVLLFVAVPLWVPQLRERRTKQHSAKTPSVQPRVAHLPMTMIFGAPLAWAVSLYFAVLSVLFYTVNAWLPTMYIEQGRSENAGGAMLTIVNIVAIPFALVVSILVHRTKSQVWTTSAGAIGLGVGLAGLYFGPAALAVLFAVLFGMGHGTATGVAFSLALLRTSTVAGTAALGGLSQTAGYTLSSIGPVGAGFLHDMLKDSVPDAWAVVVIVLVAIVGIQFTAGLLAGRDRTIETEIGYTPAE